MLKCGYSFLEIPGWNPNFLNSTWELRDKYTKNDKCEMLNLLAMIEDSFTLALSSWQASMIENLDFSTHQDVFFYVPGYAVTDKFVLLGSNA